MTENACHTLHDIGSGEGDAYIAVAHLLDDVPGGPQHTNPCGGLPWRTTDQAEVGVGSVGPHRPTPGERVAKGVLPGLTTRAYEGQICRITQATGAPPPAFLTQFGDPEGAARAALGDEAFERAHAEGYVMTVGQARLYASEAAARPDR